MNKIVKEKYIIELRCEDEIEEQRLGRILEINNYDSAIKAYFIILGEYCKDYLKIINNFTLTFSNTNTIIYKFESKKE